MARITAKVLPLLLSLACAIGFSEWFCRAFVLREKVPTSPASFSRLMIHQHERVPEPSELPTIVVLGDSFGCVGGSAENFTGVLERELRAAGRPERIVNLSISGYQTSDELGMLRESGLRYHPTLVLQAFFGGNDFEGTPAGAFVWAENRAAFREKPFSLLEPGTWAFPKFVSRTLELRRIHARAGWGGMNLHQPYPLPLGETDYAEVLRGELAHYHRSYPERPAWHQVREDTSRMVQLAQAAGARYVLVELPDRIGVEQKARAELLTGPGLRPEDFDFAQPARLLEGLARELGVSFLDLTPEFRERGRSGGLYVERDDHWNREGNVLAGKTLARWLQRSGLLAKAASREARSLR